MALYSVEQYVKETDGLKAYIEEKDVQPVILFTINKKK
jgi:hypothetical protein